MDRTHKRILIAVAVLLVLAVAVTVAVGVRKGAFNPPSHDENAVSGAPGGLAEELKYSTLAMKDGFVVSVSASPTLDENGQLEAYFTADAGNTVNVRLMVLTEDGEELGSTGLLQPGEYVRSVALTTQPAPGDTIAYRILSYEPDTYYSAGSAMAIVIVRG